MNEAQARILAEIAAERAAQDEKHGGIEHDQERSPTDWVRLIAQHAGYGISPFTAARFRAQMVRVAALAVAAIEVLDG
jgi:hypothetical protein